MLGLLISIALPSFAFPPVPVKWQSSKGQSGASNGQLVKAPSENQNILFLAWAPEIANLVSAEVKTETEEGWRPLVIKAQKQKNYILLEAPQGTLRLMLQNNESLEMTYAAQNLPGNLEISASCQKLGLKVKMAPSTPMGSPALIDCRKNDAGSDEVVFSTLEDSEWFGSKAFETGGKGERWKSFAYKDIITLKKWTLNWGSSAKPSKAMVLVPAPEQKATPPPPFVFSAGARYISGTVDKAAQSTKLDGLQIPLRLIYRKDLNTWWMVGIGYDFYAYANNSSAGSTSSVSLAQAWFGGEYAFTADFKARGMAGYSVRSISAPGVVSSTFEAPQIQGEFLYHLNTDSLMGLNATMATTSSGGTYQETDISLFYQNKFWGKDGRFALSSNQLDSTAGTTSFKSSWIGLEFSISIN